MNAIKANHNGWRLASSASAKQKAARAALDEYTGRPLNDVEWEQARSRLLDFISILRSWDRKDTTKGAELPKAA